MKQPDTAALRERLANYTPEEETDRRIAELRDLLKEISAVKDSMADIITGFTHAVADFQKKDIGARVHPDTLKALNEICTNFVVEVGKQLMWLTVTGSLNCKRNMKNGLPVCWKGTKACGCQMVG